MKTLARLTPTAAGAALACWRRHPDWRQAVWDRWFNASNDHPSQLHRASHTRSPITASTASAGSSSHRPSAAATPSRPTAVPTRPPIITLTRIANDNFTVPADARLNDTQYEIGRAHV